MKRRRDTEITRKATGKVLKHSREYAKLSQRQLAAKIGMPYSWVCKLESGTLPTLDTLLMWSAGVGVKPGALVREIDLEMQRMRHTLRCQQGDIPCSRIAAPA